MGFYNKTSKIVTQKYKIWQIRYIFVQLANVTFIFHTTRKISKNVHIKEICRITLVKLLIEKEN